MNIPFSSKPLDVDLFCHAHHASRGGVRVQRELMGLFGAHDQILTAVDGGDVRYEADAFGMEALQAVRTAEARSAVPRKTMTEPLTDISALRVSVEDVMAAGVRTEPMRWVIVRCAAMAERKVMTALQEHRIMAYLPTHRFYRRPRGVLQRAERPLMVGYVFVGLAPHQSEYDLHLIDGIAGLLKSDGVTARINPWTIVQIAAMEAAGAFDHTGPRKPAYTKDQLVRIVSGWAMGHHARVVEATDGGLRVQFEGVFKGSPVPVGEEQVEAVDIPAAA